jgi:hypothetical protein
MQALSIPPLKLHERSFDNHTVDAEVFEGLTTSNADQSAWIPYPNLDGPRSGASVFLHMQKEPQGTTVCTAAWDCDPAIWGSKMRTSGVQAEPGLHVSLTYPNPDGNIGTAAYLQGGQELVPPSNFPFEEGQSRLYKFPVMVIADKLNVSRSSDARPSDTASERVFEEEDWNKMDDGRQIEDVDSENESAENQDQDKQLSTARNTSQNTQY